MSAASWDAYTRAAWEGTIDEYPTALACSRNGNWIAVGDAGGRISLFGAGVGLERSWPAHRAPVQSLAWHPSQDVLLSGGQDGYARLWHNAIEDGCACVEIRGAGAWVDHVAFNAQGTRLAAAAGKEITMAAADGTGAVSAQEHASTVTGLAWRPDGEQAVTACYGGIQLVVAQTARIKRRFKWKGSAVSLALSPNGKVAACGCQDNSVHFWRLSAGTDAMMSGYPAKPALLSWRADSQLLAVAAGSDVTLWSFVNKGPEGTQPALLQGHRESVTALAFAPRGGGLVSGCRAGHVAFWLPGKSDQPMMRSDGLSEIAQLVWASRDDHMLLVIADVAGKVQCLAF